ncbi:5' nucleotidase, NT5C type [Leptospira sp. GIMC2001]|uniref:5' nucleotidase, NT5C type n=1 Tax=Leptospira sp. GIMC2001 TaxID=1513297 RepID=UPI00234952A6|nr:hypothetical protein [Leptospira sp. GIMC2001]WCL50728.1 hypothetical protein O4O04_07930 [Leptospira sp. GIMC2001]
MKKILYLDMDNVIVDFPTGIQKLNEAKRKEYEGRFDEAPGIFSLMEPKSGAIEAIHKLVKYFDTYVLSTSPWMNPSAWSEKLEWIQKYFGKDPSSVLYKRLILSHHKNLNMGDFLVDDREKNGAKDFKGELILFNPEQFNEWERIVRILMSRIG